MSKQEGCVCACVYVRVCMCACARVCWRLRSTVWFCVCYVYVQTYILEQTHIQAHVHTYSYKPGLSRPYPCRCRLPRAVAYAHPSFLLALVSCPAPPPLQPLWIFPARQDPAASDSGRSSRATPPPSSHPCPGAVNTGRSTSLRLLLRLRKRGGQTAEKMNEPSKRARTPHHTTQAGCPVPS